MSEADWLIGTDLDPLLQFVRGTAPSRALRLFGVACCRRFWKSFPRPLRECVEIAERHADGAVGDDALGTAWRAYLAFRDDRFGNQYAAVGHLLWGRGDDWCDPAEAVRQVAFWLQRLGGPGEQARQAHLLHDVIDNPFRLRRNVATDPLPGWVLSQLRWAYERRAFLALPVLADALEEAGYLEEEVLSHLRLGGPHVRGCWAVDLILPKAR